MSWVLQCPPANIPKELTNIIKLYAIRTNHGLDKKQIIWQNKWKWVNGTKLLYNMKVSWFVHNTMNCLWDIQELLILFDNAIIDMDHVLVMNQIIQIDDEPLENYLEIQYRLRRALKRYWNLIAMFRYHKIKLPLPFRIEDRNDFYEGNPICNGRIHIGEPRTLIMLGDMVSGVHPAETYKMLEQSLNGNNEVRVFIDPDTDWFISSQF